MVNVKAVHTWYGRIKWGQNREKTKLAGFFSNKGCRDFKKRRKALTVNCFAPLQDFRKYQLFNGS